MAAKYGNLKCLEYANENGCEMDIKTAFAAASVGAEYCLEYAYLGSRTKFGSVFFHKFGKFGSDCASVLVVAKYVN